MNNFSQPCCSYCKFRVWRGSQSAAWLFRVRRGLVSVRRGSVRVRRGSVRVGRGSFRVRRGSDSSASACCTARHPRGGSLPSGTQWGLQEWYSTSSLYINFLLASVNIFTSSAKFSSNLKWLFLARKYLQEATYNLKIYSESRHRMCFVNMLASNDQWRERIVNVFYFVFSKITSNLEQSDLELFVNMVLFLFVGNVHVYLVKTTCYKCLYIRLFTLIHCCEDIG